MPFDPCELESMRCWTSLTGGAQYTEITGADGRRKRIVAFQGIMMDYALWCTAVMFVMTQKSWYWDDLTRKDTRLIDELSQLNTEETFQGPANVRFSELHVRIKAGINALAPDEAAELLLSVC